MSVDPALLSILRCPDEHHAELELDPEAQTLTCTECGRVFPIRDGIPVLLLDEATGPAPAAGGAAGDATGEDGAA
ncbi:Trm112 family protein [Dactylosporangium sp. CA-092794]|uniref:Trm112 family protein n=1 Tax=Dactylosporangium sp. CA-092794 TaxID=3239929 RepID=UPI003D92FBE7